MMEKHSENAKRQDPKVEQEPSILELVVAEIAEDAASKPKAYLEQTIVPEGGE
jgi:hypothetical protein